MSDTKTETMYRLERSLLGTLEDNKESILEDVYPEDQLHEYVDSEIPICNSSLLEVAANSPSIALGEPDIGSDGTPIGIIQANIYCELSNIAHQWLYDAQAAADEEA